MKWLPHMKLVINMLDVINAGLLRCHFKFTLPWTGSWERPCRCPSSCIPGFCGQSSLSKGLVSKGDCKDVSDVSDPQSLTQGALFPCSGFGREEQTLCLQQFHLTVCQLRTNFLCWWFKVRRGALHTIKPVTQGVTSRWDKLLGE